MCVCVYIYIYIMLAAQGIPAASLSDADKLFSELELRRGFYD